MNGSALRAWARFAETCLALFVTSQAAGIVLGAISATLVFLPALAEPQYPVCNDTFAQPADLLGDTCETVVYLVRTHETCWSGWIKLNYGRGVSLDNNDGKVLEVLFGNGYRGRELPASIWWNWFRVRADKDTLITVESRRDCGPAKKRGPVPIYGGLQ